MAPWASPQIVQGCRAGFVGTPAPNSNIQRWVFAFGLGRLWGLGLGSPKAISAPREFALHFANCSTLLATSWQPLGHHWGLVLHAGSSSARLVIALPELARLPKGPSGRTGGTDMRLSCPRRQKQLGAWSIWPRAAGCIGLRGPAALPGVARWTADPGPRHDRHL